VVFRWWPRVRNVLKGCIIAVCQPSNTPVNRAHIFLRKLLPDSVGQFAKFRGSLRQNCPNFAVHRGLPFVSKLSSILFKNFCFWWAGWHSDIVLSYASNGQRKLTIFCFKRAICQVKLHLPGFMNVPHSFWHFSLIFFRDKHTSSSQKSY